ncbi:MAG: type II toxin-antitoxin system death-on-curing family toxin [Thermoleophilia bacterium]|nr:type II toxin-antitoxin system death-on-curing family toxin [Thermoleophilia bacterium]
MIHLDYEDALVIIERVTGAPARVRDPGLLNAALQRPRTTVMGRWAYPDLAHQAAALAHSLVANHPLLDGNKRLALGAVIAMLGVNGRRLEMTNDEAYELIMEIATGRLDDVDTIAARIEAAIRRR